MKTTSIIFISILICNIILKAQTVTLSLKGKVVYVSDQNNASNIKAGDTLTAKIIYYTNITDTNTDQTVGDYSNTKKPAGIVAIINSQTFQTDSGNVNLLVEAVNRPSNDGGTAVVFRSYNNLYPATELSWQLDDAFGTSLKNDSIITKIDLNNFEQIYGFRISAYDSTTKNSYDIQASITKIISTEKNKSEVIIAKDSSVFISDTTIVCSVLSEDAVDYEGNKYKTVKIGNQIWLKENLKSLYYADGTPVIGVYTYDNDENKAATYGRLYSWEATMRGEQSSITIPSGIQGVCPNGWHVPSDNEWYTMIKYLGGPASAGAKMKVTGTSLWETPNEGANNTSLFSVLPAGYMSSSNNFMYQKNDAVFWTTAECYQSYARYVFLDNLTTRAVVYNDGTKSDGNSVRCIKDEMPTSIIKDFQENNQLKVYPNPANQSLYVLGDFPNASVLISDLNGKILVNQKDFSSPINIQELKNGIYFIRIIDKNGETSRKFVKN